MALNWNQFFQDYVAGRYSDIKPSHASYASFLEHYRALKRIAADVLAGKGGGAAKLTPEDLAHDFLAEIQRTRNVLLNSDAGVNMQMGRLLKKLSDPASAEVWDICREALLDLEKSKQVFMRNVGTPKPADELWWSPASAANQLPCERSNDLRFVKALAKMEHIPPPAHEGRKLVSPTKAKAFVTELLGNVDCPLQMKLIHEAMCIKTSLLKVVRISKGSDSEDEIDFDVGDSEDERPSDYVTKILEGQIYERGELIGERLCAEKLCDVYVNYFYPKRVLGDAVILAGLGDARRIGEKTKKIAKILVTYLPDFVDYEYVDEDDYILNREEFESYKLHMTLEERIAFNFWKETLRRQAVDAAEKHCRHHCGGALTSSASIGGDNSEQTPSNTSLEHKISEI